MKKIKCLAVFGMLVVMAMFSSCGAKTMSISEAVDAINNLKHGGSITIVLNSDVSRITDKLIEALSADNDYLEEFAESEGLLSDDPAPDEVTKFLQKYAKKVKLDLSKTKITEIGGYAFDECLSLASITLPNSVTTIEGSAFENCMSLTNVTIPNSVTTIDYSAFNNCISLTNVTIPNSVTTIEYGTFNNCISLSRVTMPNSVTTIGIMAFCECSALKSITIPDSVTAIEPAAFKGCEALHAKIESQNDSDLIVPYNAFESDATVSFRGTTGTWKEIFARFFARYWQ